MNVTQSSHRTPGCRQNIKPFSPSVIGRESIKTQNSLPYLCFCGVDGHTRKKKRVNHFPNMVPIFPFILYSSFLHVQITSSKNGVCLGCQCASSNVTYGWSKFESVHCNPKMKGLFLSLSLPLSLTKYPVWCCVSYLLRPSIFLVCAYLFFFRIHCGTATALQISPSKAQLTLYTSLFIIQKEEEKRKEKEEKSYHDVFTFIHNWE